MSKPTLTLEELLQEIVTDTLVEYFNGGNPLVDFRYVALIYGLPISEVLERFSNLYKSAKEKALRE